MKRNRILTTAAVGVATTLALAGCSAGDGGDASGKVTIQMVESLTNPARTEIIQGLLDTFEKANPDITVKLVSPPTDQADQKIQQMLQAGTGIDVLEVRDLTVGPFTNNKWIYDMTADLKGWDGWDAMTENAKAVAQADGKTYYIPYGFYGLTLFYRTDLVKAAGFAEAPHSYDDLLKQATAIQDPSKNQYGYAFRGGANGYGNAVQAISSYVADDIDTKNAYLLTSGKTIFSAPEAKTALETYFKLFTQASPPSAVSWGYPEMVEGFTNGSTAFLLQDPEVIATVEASTTLKADQWGTAPLVVGASGKATQPLATAGWGVAESSKHKEAAVKLVEYLTSGKAAVDFAKGNSLVPIIASAADDSFYKEGPWAAYVTMTQDPATYIPVVQPRGVSWWTEWGQKADKEVQQVLLGDMTQDELLTSWDTYWTDKLAG
ncbi:ABC transporter substrate-binding protein [Microbacterium gorillae]|uniref:ABC transporter substrate-binding protein n=1 Tax=Microbacterium gorillae TaxID=1231063 RepID=UPI00058F947D|nr:sugar ABC transporter substrate-binding protein [Microbacterium gorillae]